MKPKLGKFVTAALIGRKGKGRGRVLQGVVIHISDRFIKIRTTEPDSRVYHCCRSVEIVPDSYLLNETLR